MSPAVYTFGQRWWRIFRLRLPRWCAAFSSTPNASATYLWAPRNPAAISTRSAGTSCSRSQVHRHHGHTCRSPGSSLPSGCTRIAFRPQSLPLSSFTELFHGSRGRCAGHDQTRQWPLPGRSQSLQTTRPLRPADCLSARVSGAFGIISSCVTEAAAMTDTGSDTVVSGITATDDHDFFALRGNIFVVL